MGVLTGFGGAIHTRSILEKRITPKGIYVGSVATLRAWTRVKTTPQTDWVFAFEGADAAYASLRRADQFGKLAVRMDH